MTWNDNWRFEGLERGDLSSNGLSIETRTEEAGITHKEVWQMDNAGNWDEYELIYNDVDTNFAFDFNKANEITTSGFATDAMGNLTNDTANKYSYDIEGRLSRILNQDSQVLASFYYDALGRRVRRVVEDSPDVETIFLFDPEYRLLELRDDADTNNAATDRFIHAGPGGYIDDHVVFEHNDSGWDRYYLHNDRQYSPLAATDDGGVVERYLIEPYGRVRTYGDEYSSPQSTSRIGNPLLHQGLFRDEIGSAEITLAEVEIGVAWTYYNRARQYHPLLGRFMQRDAYQYHVSFNVYEAYRGNPLRHLDPSGNAPLGAKPPATTRPAASQPASQSASQPASQPSPCDSALAQISQSKWWSIMKTMSQGSQGRCPMPSTPACDPNCPMDANGNVPCGWYDSGTNTMHLCANGATNGQPCNYDQTINHEFHHWLQECAIRLNITGALPPGWTGTNPCTDAAAKEAEAYWNNNCQPSHGVPVADRCDCVYQGCVSSSTARCGNAAAAGVACKQILNGQHYGCSLK